MTLSAAVGALAIAVVSLGVTAFFWRSRLDPDLLRASRLQRIAHDMDWNYEAGDVFDYGAMTFATLDGDRGKASNVLLGVARGGGPLCAFDYRSQRGGETERFSCVLVELVGILPHMLVEPDTAEVRRPAANDDAVRALEPVPGFPRLAIRSSDPSRTRDILRGGAAGWLAERWPDAAFEVSGSLLVAYAPLMPPGEVGDLVRATDGLRRQLDASTTDERGAGSPAT